ncbi:Similar to Ankyrin repeat domain-containing protein 50; acc. no. Q9ULJ7 [Pyronema omphalodes CBS 100304]|uniref:Similar to Ankyrin repeat domain-containing protein 50 acc. no. Q9ULJ7 n=1 Tax=Pyronema omphalodes (strain CBS 100304) TaxID=1076935 RepID=U4L3I0_PYROM|nr:Similar to Ankyrin repeat domain-containing protein 50; acc. no. Q9ULJ7 [Pyronema omphalodes CBS 100304]
MSSHGLHHYLRRLLELTDYEVDCRDCDGLTALFHAARKGHLKTVELLLERGAEVDSKDKNGRTPLSFAAKAYGSFETVKLLLERGAEVDSKNKNGRTPLSFAANEYGSLETVQLLLERGAEIDWKDKDGRTPLSYATLNDNTKIVALILERGADQVPKCIRMIS